MDDLELLKQRRLEELQNQQAQEQKIVQQIEQLEMLVKPHMTREAIERYGRVRIAHPENAVQSLVLIAEMMQKQPILINDEMYKSILNKLRPTKKKFNITRK